MALSKMYRPMQGTGEWHINSRNLLSLKMATQQVVYWIIVNNKESRLRHLQHVKKGRTNFLQGLMPYCHGRYGEIIKFSYCDFNNTNFFSCVSKVMFWKYLQCNGLMSQKSSVEHINALNWSNSQLETIYLKTFFLEGLFKLFKWMCLVSMTNI